MASWIILPVAERCPNAEVCLDPFHVVKAATDALDVVRREVCNDARGAGQRQLAKDLKGARYALWKNPENLTHRQHAKLSDIQRTNRKLYRAYLLKEQLSQIYRLPAAAATLLLDAWPQWARRCRLHPSGDSQNVRPAPAAIEAPTPRVAAHERQSGRSRFNKTTDQPSSHRPPRRAAARGPR